MRQDRGVGAPPARYPVRDAGTGKRSQCRHIRLPDARLVGSGVILAALWTLGAAELTGVDLDETAVNRSTALLKSLNLLDDRFR